jgi:short-subunit dehydrogenase
MGLDLQGKRVLLTGASSGIGWALAKALARRGAIVGLSARREDALIQLALQIRADGGEAHVLPADLSRPGAARDLAERAKKALGVVDVLVNNAGVGMAASQWIGGDGDVARALFETNVWSPLALVSAVVPDMRARGAGAIVNVSSMGAIVPFVMVGHYGASKAALATATEALRMELRGSGVDVMLVLPGPVETPMLAEAKQLDGIDGVFALSPPGDASTLARLIVRGLERGRREIVYPRPLWSGRIFPSFARWVAAWMMRRMRSDDPRLVAGGSTGGREATEARAAFEERTRAA